MVVFTLFQVFSLIFGFKHKSSRVLLEICKNSIFSCLKKVTKQHQILGSAVSIDVTVPWYQQTPTISQMK